VVIVALVGALAAVIVARWFGPDELGAKLSNVTIDRNVTLDEYAERHSDHASSGARSNSTIAQLPRAAVPETFGR